jgi:hypothetical protein
VPAEFTLTNGSAGITDAETSSTSPASLDNLFRYDATSENYISNRSTKGLTAGTYQLRIYLADGVSRPVRVSLR